MHKLIDLYCRGLTLLMVGALATMVLLVFGNVVLRYGFSSGITVSEEISRWLFVWLAFMGAVVALKNHDHLGTDVLVARLPAAGKRVCLVVAQVAMLHVSWLLLSGAWSQMRINLEVRAPVSGAPMAVLYASGVLFGASALLILARDLWRALSGQLSERDLVAVRDSEELSLVEDLHLDHSLDATERRPGSR
jgi:TRAP-type C4-dicarboxylate transport system permease small subunit